MTQPSMYTMYEATISAIYQLLLLAFPEDLTASSTYFLRHGLTLEYKTIPKGSSFLKCVVSIWALPVREGGGADVKACQSGLGHFFPMLPGG